MKSNIESDCLTFGESYEFPGHSLLLIKAGHVGCDIRINSRDKEERLCIEMHEGGMLVLTPCMLTLEMGNLFYTMLDLPHLSKLQVFIDKAQSNKKEPHNATYGYLPADLSMQPTTREIEYFFLNQSLTNADSIKSFSEALRNNEWYDLVEFLLDESCESSTQRISTLSLRYGLSVSHFRRLARQALGNTTKVEMRDWRLVRAILDLIESKNNNLTTIALKHGYASLSHFSNEVKEEFGVSPRKLKNLHMRDDS
ncbi:helix-turn-helix domain-containing protein [Erwinia sp. ErVv1]|uniref:helix-turn-helix domain-containing protein n=1 Tax=Erwinia sp. ErVv1 TaxID=1603299 RepID=UPI0009EEC260|nr:helix-turn-helix domain-containing protein [Erwinia sp. ErVv1]